MQAQRNDMMLSLDLLDMTWRHGVWCRLLLAITEQPVSPRSHGASCFRPLLRVAWPLLQ